MQSERHIFPRTGFVRLPQILTVIPVSESTWWAGVKSGKYPVGLKHGRCRFWTVEEIHELIERIAKRVGAES
jgi:prophage regulatory protein